jgi:oligopeptide transport system ATP-binding protein
MPQPILEIKGLKTHFPVSRSLVGRRAAGMVKAVDGVSLTLKRGEVLGLVGESGSGKSTLARTILRLVPATGGMIYLEGRNLSAAGAAELKAARRRLQMIFQDPYGSLNPRMTVFAAIAEPMLVHRTCPASAVADRVAALMQQVGLEPRFMRKYPHEFSGGQRQRIAVARALAVQPVVIIADEPVSALDVSIQAQILNLLTRLVREMALSMIFIAHDLSVVKHISDRVAVMYLGKIVELGRATDVIEHPRHPYTRALISAIPIPDPEAERDRRRMVLTGDAPTPLHPPAGCAFHPRCPFAQDRCSLHAPPLERLADGRDTACIRVEEILPPA